MSTLQRPPRRVVATHTWESQAVQYESRDDIDWNPVSGRITYWQVPSRLMPVPIHCLLLRHKIVTFGKPDTKPVTAYRLDGILNYYPEGTPAGEKPHDVLLLVNPLSRRQSIATRLLDEALRRWPEIDLLAQAYTDRGWAFVQSYLTSKENPHV